MVLSDFLLYIFRAATYEIPYIGGRARGRPRPVAPTLTERPDGEKRSFGLMPVGEESQEQTHAAGEGHETRPLRRKKSRHGQG